MRFLLVSVPPPFMANDNTKVARNRGFSGKVAQTRGIKDYGQKTGIEINSSQKRRDAKKKPWRKE